MPITFCHRVFLGSDHHGSGADMRSPPFSSNSHKLDLFISSIKNVVVTVVVAIDQDETLTPTFAEGVFALQRVCFTLFKFACMLMPAVPVRVRPAVAHFVFLLIPDRPCQFFWQKFRPDINFHIHWLLHDLGNICKRQWFLRLSRPIRAGKIPFFFISNFVHLAELPLEFLKVIPEILSSWFWWL